MDEAVLANYTGVFVLQKCSTCKCVGSALSKCEIKYSQKVFTLFYSVQTFNMVGWAATLKVNHTALLVSAYNTCDIVKTILMITVLNFKILMTENHKMSITMWPCAKY